MAKIKGNLTMIQCDLFAQKLQLFLKFIYSRGSFAPAEHAQYILSPNCPHNETNGMKKVNKQCLSDTPRTVRFSEKTWQVIVQTSRP